MRGHRQDLSAAVETNSDEQLQSMLTLRIEHPTPLSPADPDEPPQALLTFLAHIQISLEATYISPDPPPRHDWPRASKQSLSAPPRTSSLPKDSSKIQAYHPPIFPPNTPNPTPASTDRDRRYATSEGTLLSASIWGQDSAEDSQEAFSLLWSEDEQRWVAVYRLSLTVCETSLLSNV